MASKVSRHSMQSRQPFQLTRTTATRGSSTTDSVDSSIRLEVTAEATADSMDGIAGSVRGATAPREHNLNPVRLESEIERRVIRPVESRDCAGSPGSER